MVYMLFHNTLRIYSKLRPSYDIFLTKYANDPKGTLYIYTKGSQETPIVSSTHLTIYFLPNMLMTQKAHYITIPKAYKRLRPKAYSIPRLTRLILYIFTEGLQETPPPHSGKLVLYIFTKGLHKKNPPMR